MRVGLDARLASRGLGIARVLREAAHELSGLVELTWIGDPELAPPTVADAVRAPSPFPRMDGRAGRRLAADLRLNVLHFAGNVGWRHSGPVPVVLTIHDLIYLDTRPRGRSARQVLGHPYLRFTVPRAAEVARVITCPSATSADDVRRRLGPAAPVIVVPYGVRAPTAARSVAEPYAIAFSARDPRKGIEDAVAGWRAARTDLRLRVLAGAGVPPGFMRGIAQASGTADLEVLGHLPTAELETIVAGASVLIHASRAEGFGLPVLEAMAAGVPVISGLAPVTHELASGAFLTIDSNDVAGSIARHLRTLRSDHSLARRYAAAGHAVASRYTWRRAAEGFVEAYRHALAVP